MLKLLSWNIWGGKHLDGVIEFLRQSDAEIIALQEVVQNLDGTDNSAKLISEKLGFTFVFFESVFVNMNGPKDIGNAIISKFPVVESKKHILSEPDTGTAVQADINVAGKRISVYSTHLLHTHQKPSPEQEQQAKNLVGLVRQEKSILMGDLNATPESKTYMIVNSSFVDTDTLHTQKTWSKYPEGCETCKPEGLVERLDYIFVSPDIQVKSFAVGQSNGSDHLPITATVEF